MITGFDLLPRAVFSPVRAGSFTCQGITMPFLQCNVYTVTGSWPFIDHSM